MLRLTILLGAVLALAGSAESGYSFNQRGTVATPRAALGDGQPLAAAVRLEGHAGTTLAANPAASGATAAIGGAAAARSTAGAALRARIGSSSDLGLEVDTEWAPSSTTRDGVPIATPSDPVVDVAFAARTSSKLDATGDLRVGLIANLGAHQTPIDRGTPSYPDVQHDAALLFRLAVVPSLRRGPVTLFGSLGLASETGVPGVVDVGPYDDDPGVVARTTGVALTLAAGATVDVGEGLHVCARIGDALTDQANGHYGPQVDASLAVDLGK